MSSRTWIASWCAATVILVAVSAARAEPPPPDSAAHHVPPDPPHQVMGDMTYGEMKSMMQMDDTHRFGKVMLDRIEWHDPEEGAMAAWDAQGWYGGDYDKLWLKTEGERVGGVTRDARVELLADRVVARWWDAQAGIRQDFGQGPARTWLAVGLEGLAPYWLDVEATLYVGEQGRTAARLKADYDVLLTQRFVLQPYAQANLYGKPDRQRRIGSGLSDLELSLRLRYEIRRELAPYLGVVWSRRFGSTAELVRAGGESSDDVQLVAGLRVWF